MLFCVGLAHYAKSLLHPLEHEASQSAVGLIQEHLNYSIVVRKLPERLIWSSNIICFFYLSC